MDPTPHNYVYVDLDCLLYMSVDVFTIIYLKNIDIAPMDNALCTALYTSRVNIAIANVYSCIHNSS